MRKTRVTFLAIFWLAGCSGYQDLQAPVLLEKDTHPVNSQIDVPVKTDRDEQTKK